MEFSNLIASVIALTIVLLGLGLITGIVKPGVSLFKWIIFLVIVIPVMINVGVPLLQHFYYQYGRLAFFLLICTVIVVIMFCFSFTRAILASVIAAFIYDSIVRKLLLFTGVSLLLTGLVYSLAKWIMQ